MTEKRRKRLKAIRLAQQDIESALLTLKLHFKVTWIAASFGHLYYLIALAKKAP